MRLSLVPLIVVAAVGLVVACDEGQRSPTSPEVAERGAQPGAAASNARPLVQTLGVADRDAVNLASPGVPAQVWSLFGNRGSDPAKDKLGTTDAADLVIVTNNTEGLRLTADGEVKIKNSLEIGKDLTVKNSVFLNTNCLEHNVTAWNGSTCGQTINNGSLTVANSRPTRLTGTLEVSGATTLNSTLDANGQVTINAPVSGADSDYGAYPLRVQGGNQGVAIKVGGSRSNDNNFVTFFDDSGIWGRIEGQTTTELLTDPEYIVENAILVAQEAIAIENQAAALTSSTIGATTTPPPIPVATSPIPSLIAAAAVELATQTAQLVAFNAFKNAQIGVTYQSGAGDYAEWLPKANPADEFYPGDIVGGRGGTISSRTDGAEHVFVISSRPAVLANMPAPGTEAAYEMVAFMGQVPVKVLGVVERGDYIIPSGRNDGFGRAVKASELRPEQYRQIVGIAWSSSASDGFNLVSVAVGLNANDVSRLVIDQASEIEGLKQQLARTNEVLASLLPGYRDSLESIRLAAAEPVDAGPTTPSIASPAAITGTSTDPKAYELTREDLINGLALAEQQLRQTGAKVDENPFLQRLKTDARYKERIINSMVEKYNSALRQRSEPPGQSPHTRK